LRFEPLPQFIFRAPGFSVVNFLAFFKDGSIADLLRNKNFMEAVRLASPGFVDRIDASIDDESRIVLLKYLSRSISRPTPFGFFSGVGSGVISTHTALPEDHHQHTEKFIADLRLSHRDNKFVINPTLVKLGSFVRFEVAIPQKNFPFDRTEVKHIQLPRPALELLKKVIGPISEDDVVRLLIGKKTGLNHAASLFFKELVTEGVFVKAEVPHFDKNVKPLSGLVPKDHIGYLHFSAKASMSRKDADKILSAVLKMKRIAPKPPVLYASSLLRSLQSYLEKNHNHKLLPLTALFESQVRSFNVSLNDEDLFRARKEFLIRKVRESIRRNQWSWSLSAQEVEELENHFPHRNDFEVPVFSVLVAASQNESGKFEFGIRGAAHSSAARLFARHAFHLPAAQEIVKTIQNIEQTQSNKKLAELELRIAHRNSNHRLHRSIHVDSFIDNGGFVSSKKKRIPVSDLGFFLTSESELRLIQLSTLSEVDPIVSHLCVPSDQEPFTTRLLYDFSQRKSWKPFWDWLDLPKIYDHFPQISIGGVIVTPEIWILRNEEPNNERMDIGQLEQMIQNLEAIGCPSEVMLFEKGERLYLNMNLDWCRQVLLKKLNQDRALVLERVLGSVKKQFEICLGAKAANSRFFEDDLKLKAEYFLKLKRPEVFYLKIFCSHDSTHFILRAISRFLLKKESFFIRYADPEPHLRVRFFDIKSGDVKKLYSKINSLKVIGLISRTEISEYEPELVRYLGKEGLLLFEKISSLDSRIYLEFLMIDKIVLSEDLEMTLGAAQMLIWAKLFLREKESVENYLFDRIQNLNLSTRTTAQISLEESFFENLWQINKRYSSDLKSISKEFLRLSKKWDKEEKVRYVDSVIHMNLNRQKGFTFAHDKDFLRLAYKFLKSHPRFSFPKEL